jgi:hypothetical protein
LQLIGQVALIGLGLRVEMLFVHRVKRVQIAAPLL